MITWHAHITWHINIAPVHENGLHFQHSVTSVWTNHNYSFLITHY